MEVFVQTDEIDEKRFNQTCYMSAELMLRLGATIRSCIEIKIGKELILCVVYPKQGMSKDVVLYSKSVLKVDPLLFVSNSSNVDRNTSEGVVSQYVLGKLDDSKSLTLNSLKSSGLNIIYSGSSNSLRVLKCGGTKVANIRVVFHDSKKLQYFRGNSGHLYKLQEQCQNCLSGIAVAESSSINLENMRLAQLYGIAYIHIESITPSKKHLGRKCFIVTKSTEITIVKLHSADWYEHMRERTNSCRLGGLSNLTSELLDLIEMPILHKCYFNQLGVKPPKGILLRGPPGCGKTSLVKHVAFLSRAYLKVINGPEILGSLPGETESNLEKAFMAAVLMSEEGPCILFIDEMDSLCPRSSKSSKLQQSRVTGKLLSLLDGLSHDQSLVIIGATNRPSVLDPAIRRPGRMDREVSINPPTMKQRREILEVYLNNLPVTNDLDLDKLADVTNGYVGADLASLCQEAAYAAMGVEGQGVSMENFMNAVKKIRPSLQRGAEGLVDLRPVYWQDIGGLEHVKAEIKQAVEWPLKHPEAFRRMGLAPSKGVLLYGPPGCCKTTLVRAAATSCHATFLSISGAQLYSPYVGDSEKLLCETFQRARQNSPSIIFLDEIDSIVRKRSDSGRSGVQDRVLSTLLNEMDGVGIKVTDSYGSSGSQKLLEGEQDSAKVNTGLESRDILCNNSVLLVAATNRPDLLDEALMRPGRIDKIIYVPHPDLQARKEILKVYSKKMGTCNTDIDNMAEKTDMYTGADLENLCREAALCALTERMESTSVDIHHFTRALSSVKPSLNDELIEQYSKLNVSTVK